MIGESVDKIGGLGVSDFTEKLQSAKLGDSKALRKVFDTLLPEHEKKKQKKKKDKEKQEHRGNEDGDHDDDEDPDVTIHRLDDLQRKSYSVEGDGVHQALVTIFKAHDSLSRQLSGSATFSNDSGVVSSFRCLCGLASKRDKFKVSQPSCISYPPLFGRPSNP